MSAGEVVPRLADEVARVTALLRSVRHPQAPCLGEWSLADVAAHLRQAWLVVPALARDEPGAVRAALPDAEPTAAGALLEDIWDLGMLTTRGVASEPVRDLRVLAHWIDASADAFLQQVDELDEGRRHAWLVEGVSFPLVTLLGHLLSETLVHGHDIAHADGRRWHVRRAPARLALERFVIPVIGALPPRAMVDQHAAAGLRATFRLHVRGGGTYTFAFDDGALAVDTDVTGPVDCHISADPVGLLLVAWGRRSVWRAALSGELVAWGRRPSLALRFRSLLRNP